MCTAITIFENVNLFGRTLDWFHSFDEQVIITPQNYNLSFVDCGDMSKHYAIIGMGIERRGYPLYFDAFNEKGLSVAGLNFADNAVYGKTVENLKNIASYEFIPWILGQCSSVAEAAALVKKTNITDTSFGDDLPSSPLHWIIADGKSSITVEPLLDGIKIYENKIGVLTNNPPFDFHMENIKKYMALSPEQPKNAFSKGFPLKPNSFGFGALGLPGDFSSQSRFVRAAFIKENAELSEEDKIYEFFKVLSSVSLVKGCVLSGGEREYTVYSSCHDIGGGIYYYNVYGSNQINAVSIKNADTKSAKLLVYETENAFKINFLN